MRQLAPEARLERREQVELAAVIHTVMTTTQRHDAVGVVAAAQRARHQVGRVDRPGAAYQGTHAPTLSRWAREAGLKAERRNGLLRRSGAERRSAALGWSRLRLRSGPLRRIADPPQRDHCAVAVSSLPSPTRLPQQLRPAIDEPVADPTPVHDVADRTRPLELAAQAARVRVERPAA